MKYLVSQRQHVVCTSSEKSCLVCMAKKNDKFPPGVDLLLG